MTWKDPEERRIKQHEYTRKWRLLNREKHLFDRLEYKKKISVTEEGKLQRRKEALKHNYGMSLEE